MDARHGSVVLEIVCGVVFIIIIIIFTVKAGNDFCF